MKVCHRPSPWIDSLFSCKTTSESQGGKLKQDESKKLGLSKDGMYGSQFGDDTTRCQSVTKTVARARHAHPLRPPEFSCPVRPDRRVSGQRPAIPLYLR